MKCLSVRQPWAWAIVEGLKDVENRSWPTNFRGEVLIHAGKQFDFTPKQYPKESAEWAEAGFDWKNATRGAIVGVVEIYDCVRSVDCDSPWSAKDFDVWCFLIRNARKFDTPLPMAGKLGFFEVGEVTEVKHG